MYSSPICAPFTVKQDNCLSFFLHGSTFCIFHVTMMYCIIHFSNNDSIYHTEIKSVPWDEGRHCSAHHIHNGLSKASFHPHGTRVSLGYGMYVERGRLTETHHPVLRGAVTYSSEILWGAQSQAPTKNHSIGAARYQRISLTLVH